MSQATLTITPTGHTWKAIVRHAAGTDASYHHPTREAAQASGERMAQDVPAEQPVCGRAFRVAGAGRLMGR